VFDANLDYVGLLCKIFVKITLLKICWIILCGINFVKKVTLVLVERMAFRTWFCLNVEKFIVGGLTNQDLVELFELSLWIVDCLNLWADYGETEEKCFIFIWASICGVAQLSKVSGKAKCSIIKQKSWCRYRNFGLLNE
jgi:hypothetical protein